MFSIHEPHALSRDLWGILHRLADKTYSVCVRQGVQAAGGGEDLD
jgi:hypothetical protein